MPQALLESQLATLERPTPDKPALQVIGNESVEAAVDEILDRLGTDDADGAVPASLVRPLICWGPR